MVRMNGIDAGTLDMSPTTILGLGVGEGLDLGCDRRLHVSAHYGGAGACAYSNQVAWMRIEPGPQAPDSYANRPERLAQRD
jgi:arylsulfatase